MSLRMGHSMLHDAIELSRRFSDRSPVDVMSHLQDAIDRPTIRGISVAEVVLDNRDAMSISNFANVWIPLRMFLELTVESGSSSNVKSIQHHSFN